MKELMNHIWSRMTDEEKRVEIEYAQKLFSSVPDAVDFLLEHAKGPDWDVVQRAMKTLEESFTKKAEDKHQKYFGNNPDTTN